MNNLKRNYQVNNISYSGLRILREIVFAMLMVLLLAPLSIAQKLLIPMDLNQRDHLKAYGVAYWIVNQGGKAEWLLNYRNGSFLTDESEPIIRLCRLKGVNYELINASALTRIYSEIEQSNMEAVPLEKAPKIAVYAPDSYNPWDDAVMLALEYAEIPYDRIYDDEVLSGALSEYDWLHLHHEDFTGQLGKFYGAYRHTDWYKAHWDRDMATANRWNFPSISELRKYIAREIKKYVEAGGFLFSMCSGTDTFDIALAAEGVDIVDVPFNGTPPDPQADKKLDFDKTLAFHNFKLVTDPNIYAFSNIDMTNESGRGFPGSEMGDYFTKLLVKQ